MKVKTPEQVKKSFNLKGIPVSKWAKENGYTPQEVYKVLNGQTKGNFGKSHSIAVALGIKEAEAVTI